MSHDATHEHLASVTVSTAGGGSSEAHLSHIYEIVNILGKRDLRMLLPLFESDPADNEPVQDISQRGNHFLKHTTGDNDPYIKGELLSYRLNGVNEAIDMASDAQFSFGADGTAPNEPSFSVGAAVRFNDSTQNAVISRADETNLANEIEYLFWTGGDDKINLRIYDEVATAMIGAYNDDALLVDRWYIIIGTYDGSAVNTGVNVYVDGVVNNVTVGAGAYTAMHAMTVVTAVGYQENGGGALAEFVDGDVALPFITARELSAADVLRLTNIYREVLHI